MQNKPSVAILVTNYNTWELVQRCVEACYRHDEGRFDTLLVYDDCSQTQFAGGFPATTRVCRGPTNLGLTKALNVAFGLISEDIVVLFDSDAYPTIPFCDEVKKMFEENPNLGLLGFRTVGQAGRPTQSYTTEPNIWSLLLGQALYSKTERWFRDKSGRVSIFTCAMAVRMTAFKELNGFDANFDWLDLDHDFSMRMNRSRWQTAIAPVARVFHEGSGTPQLVRNRVLRHYKARWYLLDKFDRLPLKSLSKILILCRLCVEYVIFLGFGPILIRNKAVLGDKIQGRRELIVFCLKNY
jgi:GT2 family glycosyltransferase